MKKCCLFVAFLILSGCFQAYNEDDEIRTVPVTNNPNLIPNHGSLMPGMGESTPY